jgi:SAM-dependent methyltransferase
MSGTEAATVVLPVHGVRDAAATVVRDLAVAAYALRTRAIQLDVLLLCGNPDDVTAVAAKTAADLGLSLSVSAGHASAGAAYLAGFRQVLDRSGVDLVITLDPTGQHDATQLPHLIDQLLAEKLDVVIGSRWARHSGTPGLNLRRWVLGRLANVSFREFTGIRGLTDVTTTFRVVRTDALRVLDLDTLPSDLRGMQMALVAEAVGHGLRVAEGPIIYRAPAAAVEPITARDVTSFVRHLAPLRRRAVRIRRDRLSAPGRRFEYRDFGAAEDLERLGTANRFFNWTLEEFDRYLHGIVLEVGAGLGTITRLLVESRPDLSVVALEPAGNLFGALASYAALNPRVAAHRQTVGEYLAEPREPFDAIVYLNVLEHIADDEAELRLAARALRPGGALLVFGPALSWLYSELDYKAGHYRRYGVRGLREMVTAAGFEVVSLRYFDVLGVLPYYVVYRLLRRPGISGSTMWGYDRLLVPASRLLQRALRKPPLGKNVILVARRPSGGYPIASRG